MDKEKYENCQIIKKILSNEFNAQGNLEACMYFKFLDLDDKKSRKRLKDNIKEISEICNKALKELES